MTTRRLLGLGLMLLATSGLAGCAGPHYLTPDPKRSVQVPAAGQGQEISVTARDTRQEASHCSRRPRGSSSRATSSMTALSLRIRITPIRMTTLRP